MRSPAVAIAALLVLTGALAGCVADSSWALSITGIQALQDRGLTGKGIKVAIIDTGIDPSHPEFKGLRAVWHDFVRGQSQPYDDSEVGHGTHVAGIIVAQGDLLQDALNGVRLKGAAPGVSLIIAKAVGGDGEGKDEDVADAVDFAVAQGAHVIVMSLGGKAGGLLLGTDTESSVKNAINRGIVVVAAAGNKLNANESQDDVASPASVEGVIAVGAVDKDKRIASFSYKGDDGCALPPSQLGCRTDPDKKPELVAPGVQILSTARDQKYAIADGTSQAAPFVGAAVALMLEAKPDYRAGGSRSGAAGVEAIKNALARGAEKVGPLAGQGGMSHDDLYGYGLLRADRALERL
ncbi:MAG TPA: S8 family serine peptidase [Candidatus Thermoplasmatota archaeon]|nr:S8 family serine peptidase [Candidatus Thermoplasmatota archaeon]